jgi:hypothetical protein
MSQSVCQSVKLAATACIFGISLPWLAAALSPRRVQNIGSDLESDSRCKSLFVGNKDYQRAGVSGAHGSLGGEELCSS